MTNTQVSAKQAEAPVFPAKNRVFLAGEVLALTDTGIVLKTINKTARGDHEERHPIAVDPSAITAKGFDVGARIQFYGLIAAGESRIQRVHAYAQTISKAASELDANVVEIAGIIGTTAYTPADPLIGKQGFARSFVNVGKPGEAGKNVRVVMFQDMARIWEKVPPGSDVLIGGRIRNRERNGFVTAEGDLAIYTEVIAEPLKSRVLRKAVVVDAFAGVDFEALEQGMELSAQPELQTEAPKGEAPAKARKNGKRQAPAEMPEASAF